MGRMHFSNNLGGFNLVDIFGIFILFFVIVSIKYIKNKVPNEKLKDSAEIETLENFESLIFAMLGQNKDGLTQQEISVNLNLPLNLVSEKLEKMEKNKQITREWLNEEYTYKIKLV